MELMLHQFIGYVEEGEITHLPKYNFYMRIAAGESQEAFSGETIVLEGPGDEDVAKRVVAASQKNYAKEHVEPKEEVAEPSKQDKSTTKANKPKTTTKRKASTKKTPSTNKQAKPLIPKKNKLS